MLCCPEDVEFCHKCANVNKDNVKQICCVHCRFPICKNCRVIMTRTHKDKIGVPMALCNDNFWGFVSDVIARLQVRWIEAAAIMPCWTNIVVFYVEGSRGHLMDETLFKGSHRTAVHGKVWSVHLPWEDVVRSLNETISDQELSLIHI